MKDTDYLNRLYCLTDNISKLVHKETPLAPFIKALLIVVFSTVDCKVVKLHLKGDNQNCFYSASIQSPDKYLFEEKKYMPQSKNIFSNIIEFITTCLNYSFKPSSFPITKNKSICINIYTNKESTNKKSTLFIPFKINSEEAGVFELVHKKDNYFTDDFIAFCEAAAQIVRISIEEYNAKSSLKERVKELSCLYQISKIAIEPLLSLDQLMKKICNTIKESLKYPTLVIAEIFIKDISLKSKPNLNMFIQENIYHRDEVIGWLEISYPNKVKELDTSPFLKEEKYLIKEIARQISIILEKRTSKEEKIKIEEQLRHADRLSIVGELAAGVAHELNEPLGNILGFSQLIKKDKSFSDQISGDIEKIIKASLYSREIIKNLLTFAHQIPTNFTLIDLNEIISDGLFFFKSRCEKEGIILNQNLLTELPKVKVDPSQINQIIVNLVVNAIQAMPNGGTLDINTSHDKNNVMISIKDTGFGIKKNNIKKIFDPFFTTKDIGKGTGLGLSVVHGIIQSHKGKIVVSSEINKGSNFTIILPIKHKDYK
jgi:signal transduction histidine kinase